MKIETFALALVLALSACADPQEYKVPPDSDQWKQDEGFKDAIQKLSEEERQLLKAYLLRAGMAEALGGTIPEITIAEGIQNQQEFLEKRAAKKAAEAEEEAKQAALAAKVEEEHQAAVAAAHKALTVAVSSMTFVPSNFRARRYQDGFTLSIALQNNTDKDMVGIKGTVVFADMFDDEIKRVDLSVDETIAAGKSIRWEGSLGYNQFMSEDTKLRNTEFAKLKISWEPEVYLFSDGSKMEIEG